MDLDLAKELGAEPGFSTQRLTLFLPNKDRHGVEFPDFERWYAETRALLAQIGGGSTAYPPADGNWVSPIGEIIWESTRIVFCFVHPDRFRERIGALRKFLHRFGRATDQGEVVVEFDDTFWRIIHFSAENGEQK